MKSASIESWNEAQRNEKLFHSGSIDIGLPHYKHTYEQYFKYLNTGFDQKGKSILEIGPADLPALHYCTNYGPSYIIEPMPSEILNGLIKDKPITLFTEPAENLQFPKVDEVWILNLLQHVIDPTLIIQKAKESANVIRFFEPINDTTDVCHLHSFTLEYFKEMFGDCVKYYEDHKGKVQGFHEHESVYGVWVNPTMTQRIISNTANR